MGRATNDVHLVEVLAIRRHRPRLYAQNAADTQVVTELRARGTCNGKAFTVGYDPHPGPTMLFQTQRQSALFSKSERGSILRRVKGGAPTSTLDLTRLAPEAAARRWEDARETLAAREGKRYLAVPKAQRRDATERGAEWDRARRRMYVPPGVSGDFTPWETARGAAGR